MPTFAFHVVVAHGTYVCRASSFTAGARFFSHSLPARDVRWSSRAVRVDLLGHQAEASDMTTTRADEGTIIREAGAFLSPLFSWGNHVDEAPASLLTRRF